jgi:RNA polymerase I-specific transcription initiation factor RRN7
MLYVMAKRLANVRSVVPLTQCGAIAPGLPKIKASDVMRHVSDNAPVEVQCMATLIIVLKMVYGLDGKAR